MTAYLAATTAVVILVGTQLGRELFPRVNAGQFQMRVRPSEGTHFDLTRKVAEKSLEEIAETVGKENVATTMGYVGAIPPQFTVNLAYQWSRGPDDSMLRVALHQGSGIDVFEVQEKLRKVLPEKVGPWFRDELKRLGVEDNLADELAKKIVFAFEPGDLVSATMSLGSPAPIEVVVNGRELSATAEFMDKILDRPTFQRPSEADHHDELRDDLGHDPDISCSGGRERAERPSEPCRDGRDGDVDIRRTSCHSGRLLASHGQGE